MHKRESHRHSDEISELGDVTRRFGRAIGAPGLTGTLPGRVLVVARRSLGC